MDTGLLLSPAIGRSAALAQMAEGMGFASLALTDSQNLAPEVWSHLHLAGAATKRILLGPGVTNSVTRDPAVTASAALSLQAETQGRAFIAIGRGDSAVQRLGQEPDVLARFRKYLESLQTYLRGESVLRNGFESRIEWHRAVKQPKVPVHVACTGPKVIELAARVADAVIFAVGADTAHLAAGIERARAAAAAHGRKPGELRLGAFINTVVHPDPAVARNAVRGVAATFARFSSFKGSPLESLPAPLANAARYLRENYDMKHHTRMATSHAAGLGDEFVDWFAVAGPPEQVRSRLQALRALGLDFITLIAGSHDTPREITVQSLKLLSTEIVPALA